MMKIYSKVYVCSAIRKKFLFYDGCLTLRPYQLP